MWFHFFSTSDMCAFFRSIVPYSHIGCNMVRFKVTLTFFLKKFHKSFLETKLVGPLNKKSQCYLTLGQKTSLSYFWCLSYYCLAHDFSLSKNEDVLDNNFIRHTNQNFAKFHPLFQNTLNEYALINSENI